MEAFTVLDSEQRDRLSNREKEKEESWAKKKKSADRKVKEFSPPLPNGFSDIPVTRCI
ncbi:MAG TPA: hypothetical protein VFG51_01220 [Candidatus Saccharimonadia bacterium]|nr:hypothetical protein [Candidatus Saccharimonadia bacterium]